MQYKLGATCLLTLAISTAALAQPAPPPLPQAVDTKSPGQRNPANDILAARALAQSEGLSEAEAAQQLQVEPTIVAFIEQLEGGSLPEYAGVRLKRKPAFQLTVFHTGPSDAFRQKLSIPAELSPIVTFRSVKNSLRVLQAQQQRFLKSPVFRDLDFATYIDPEANRIVIQSRANQNIRERGKQSPGIVPDDVEFVDEDVPPQTAGVAPSGAYPPKAGDWLEAGHHYHGWVLNSSGTAYEARRECTWGFATKLGTQYGLVTAGHCEPSDYGTGYFQNLPGHWVEHWGPDYESNGIRTAQKYDFQFHRMPGIKVYNTVGIYNSEGTSSSATYYVNGTEGRTAQAASTSCYYGRISKFRCASVFDNNYFINENGRTYGPWVRLYYNGTLSTAVPEGDSGGPVMNSPSGGWIKARGIISRSKYYVTLGKIEIIYMPIDHIDDVEPIQVLTSPSP